MLKYASHIVAVVSLALIAACSGSPSSQAGNTQAEVAVYPPGIQPFKNPTAAFNAGLYTNSSIRGCCFLKQRASLTLEKPAGARVATLSFFVPEAEPFKSGESVTVSAGGASATASSVAGKWIAISLAFPARFIARTAVPIEIVAAKSFNPAKLGINGDTRDLGVVLQKVEYR